MLGAWGNRTLTPISPPIALPAAGAVAGGFSAAAGVAVGVLAVGCVLLCPSAIGADQPMVNSTTNPSVSGGAVILNNDTANRPPPGSRPIDQTPWSGDHQEIKEAIGAGPRDSVRISPGNEVWTQNPDGTWTNYGPAGDYTGSGQPSGRTGRDRDR